MMWLDSGLILRMESNIAIQQYVGRMRLPQKVPLSIGTRPSAAQHVNSAQWRTCGVQTCTWSVRRTNVGERIIGLPRTPQLWQLQLILFGVQVSTLFSKL